MIKISKGLDLPISGTPENILEDVDVRTCGVLGTDHVGFKPTLKKNIGDEVKAGEILLENKKDQNIYITSPASGRITDINRGNKRRLLSIEIDIDDEIGSIEFNTDNILDLLINSGYFSFFKTRPFNRTPHVDDIPKSIFVNCCDTNPLSIDPFNIITLNQELFDKGLEIISKLYEVPVYCTYQNDDFITSHDNVEFIKFNGPHPAGLVGTHIHMISPVNLDNVVWSIGFQEVMSIGYLYIHKMIRNKKTIALGGEGVYEPKLLNLRYGSNIDEAIAGKIKGGVRVISGSVLNGISSSGAMKFIGTFDNQISVIPDNSNDILFNWLMPGKNLHSKLGTFISSWIKPKKFIFNTSKNGGNRAIVPLPSYEEVMPLNILSTQLLKAIVTKDIELAIRLGALELSPEDLALLSYVCPSKYDYQTILADNLNLIYEEMS